MLVSFFVPISTLLLRRTDYKNTALDFFMTHTKISSDIIQHKAMFILKVRQRQFIFVFGDVILSVR